MKHRLCWTSRRLAVLAAWSAVLIGCDGCDRNGEVPRPAVNNTTSKSSPVHSATTAGGSPRAVPKAAGQAGGDGQPSIQGVSTLPDALNAPRQAVTSQGRFAELMRQGLSKFVPRRGLVFASAGVDRPTLRVVVAPDGAVQWARGRGGRWENLSERGAFELADDQRMRLAGLIDQAWIDADLTYPPSAVNSYEVLILRDGDTVRVIEGTGLPRELQPMKPILTDATSGPTD